MKVSMKSIAAAAFMLYSRVATAAAPNVTAVSIGTVCTSFPGYPGFGGSGAGPFIGIAASTGQAIDGIGLNVAYYMDETRRYGYVAAWTSFPMSNIPLRCFNQTLEAQLKIGPDSEEIWQPLVISGDPALKGALGFGFPEDKYPNIPVEAYWHFVNGEQVPGVFLGAKDSTTFGFVYNQAGLLGSAGEYYVLRLLGTEGFTKWELTVRDTVGFLQVTYD
ncbi:hypothetical protein F5B22DRAFT_659174 [Xylaria bambusicola]|uniref:uncharacterized protein n=1 Tax=Xylaria bambusicola TaxID=326684 RepID=UPI002008A12B|nr:uncharacterized protein F5B22DRAFT_659174 [Xylaria bambusicola]KAI0508597.1 hypothetical protein F5B22DRAFT_659174 [Xylaria bambusicola]